MGDTGIWVAVIMGVVAVITSFIAYRGTKQTTQLEFAQKRSDSADQQESVLRGDLFKAWEREQARAQKAEEDKGTMAKTISDLTAKVTEISKQADAAAQEVVRLTAKVQSLEDELHREQANNTIKQQEINSLNQDVARLNRKVASLENGINGGK